MIETAVKILIEKLKKLRSKNGLTERERKLFEVLIFLAGVLGKYKRFLLALKLIDFLLGTNFGDFFGL